MQKPHRNAALAVLWALLTHSPAAPTAVADGYDATEDSPLVVGAPGLLGNDDAGGAPSLSAARVTNPTRGTVMVNADGSFTYTPNANYSGLDSFTYKATQSLGPITFTVDQPNSVMNVKVDSQTYITGGTSDSKTTTAQVSGNATVQLNPGTAPFSTAQIQTLNLTLAQQVSMTLCVQRILFCTATLTATIAPGGLAITMAQAQAGPAVNVDGAGIFNQVGNKINTTGTISLSGSGLAGLIDIPPTADLSSVDQPYDFNNAVITQNGGTLNLSVPLDITQSFAESGDINNPGLYKATVRVWGTMRATAPVPLLEESAPATVTIDVAPVDDLPTAVNDRYYSRQNFPISVPATAPQTTETLIPTLASWKYRTGTDLGTAWRNAEYNDTGWASVSGLKGYGDADILAPGTIPARANMGAAASSTNPNYPTAYFRKEVTLTNPYDTVQPKITIQRDDAAMVWVNGVEVYRDSTKYVSTDANPPLPASGEVAYATYSAATIPNADETVYKEITFSRSVLREGKNVIAVAVKQATNTSSDLRFDATFSRTRGVQGLLVNDTDIENDPITAELVSLPASGGAAAVNANGSFSYVPGLGFTGTDSFIYRLRQNGAVDTGTTEVISLGASWKTVNPTSTLDAVDWKSAAYDDSAWVSGPAPMGYGTGNNYPEIAATGTTLDWGTDAANKPITHYFRKKFTLGTPKALITAMKALIRRDDGVAVWLNGVEVFRENLPGTAGDGTLTFSTRANAALNALPNELIEATLPMANVIDGENTLAVEIHQAAPTSSDVVFDLSLLMDYAPGARVEVVVLSDDADNDNVSDTWERAHGLNAAQPSDANTDNDGDGQSNRLEFLAGTNPNVASEVLRVKDFVPNGANLNLTFPSVAGRTYQLQCSDDLTDWSASGPSFSPGTNSSHLHSFAPVPGCAFYRIVVLNQWD